MAQVTFDTLLSQVRPEAQECPSPRIINEIRNVARDFCERTTYWRHEHPTITTVTDANSDGFYPLTIPSGAQIASVISPIQHGGINVYVRTKDWLDANFTRWREREGNTADYYRMITPTIMRLIPKPTEAKDLEVSIVLKPSRNADSIPDYIYDEWYEVLSWGALAGLLNMEKEPWYRPKDAAMYFGKYMDGVNDGKAKGIREFTKNTVDRRRRTKGHYF